ncbi:alpha/beta hydrolase family protein [Pedobacter agri]|uniref:hypothetical protein n=1 Tax=Pedobacter agri TaxID=454586 RepID=UPI00292D9D7D|nr:hypothetical protein [Pedobacter agri]
MRTLFFTIFLINIWTFSSAQDIGMLQSNEKPLVLRSIGSFYVGGEPVVESRVSLNGKSKIIPARDASSSSGHITKGQMYVQYSVPFELKGDFSLVLVHGMTLTGKTYETTPDGRMGWYEYFLRKGIASYIVDQTGFGRSGFDQRPYNDVKAGLEAPKSQPPFMRYTDEELFPAFRIGNTFDKSFPNMKFSLTSYRELSKQSVPFKPLSHADSVANYKNLGLLSSKLKNTIIFGHSQSGDFPVNAALLSTEGIKGAVIVEPSSPFSYSDEEIKKMSKMPMLVIFGDYLDTKSEGSNFTWEMSYNAWKILVERVNKVGGNAKMLHLPEIGIKGNSHMIMQDDNNLEIADIILKWIASL